MDDHSIGLFIHIGGALGFFAALGLEWTGLGQIRSATLPELVRAWIGILKNAHKVQSVSMLVIALTGIYSLVVEWGGVPWIIVSLGSFVLAALLAVVLTGPRMALIARALATEERPTPHTFHNLASHPLLWISIQTRVAIGLGVLFLMLVKSDYGESLLAIGVAIVLGVASAFPALRKELTREQSARMIIALLVIVFVAALALLAENSISASTIPSARTSSDLQVVPTKPIGVQTEAGSINLSTTIPSALSALGPTPSPKTASPDGPSILQNSCT